MFTLLLSMLAGVVSVHAFPNGAPIEACLRGMRPNHSPYVPQRVESMPFSVSQQTFRGGIRVTIESTEGRYFKGFMVQARDPSTGRPATSSQGSWQPVEHVKQLPECSAVTHADRGQKAGLTVTWKGRQDLQMRVTVLESYSTFWSDVLARENQLQSRAPVSPAAQPFF